jgi:TetR/AcrR family transcriptional repressor of bet genes
MTVQQERTDVPLTKDPDLPEPTGAAPRFKRLSAEDRAGELVRAGLEVLATGGITAFTIDNICKKAGASRGLIGHHFGGKDGLLAACYAAAYAPLLHMLQAGSGTLELPDLIDELFSARHFRRDGLNIWLALWGEIAVNPALQAEHLRHYRAYEAAVTQSIADFARAKGRKVEAATLATTLIALLDGLWLELCIAPGLMSLERARHAVLSLLEPQLGPLI